MKAWIGYLRVSTEEQMKGEGIEVQRDAIAQDAAAAGATVVAWHTDEAASGSNGMETRAGLAEAVDDLRQRDGATLAVYKLDRLARDLMLQESLLADIWRQGGHVHSCSEGEAVYCRPDDPSDPSRKLIRQVLGAVAEYERAMIRARMVAGRRRKLAHDGYAGGPAPFGWRHAVGGGIEPDEAEQAVLASVTELRDEGLSWQAVTDRLNETGMLRRGGTPWTKGDIHRTMVRVSARSGLVSA